MMASMLAALFVMFSGHAHLDSGHPLPGVVTRHAESGHPLAGAEMRQSGHTQPGMARPQVDSGHPLAG